ncbi:MULTISPECIES: dihydrodipicolinate synthase family protein [Anaerotruncus]|jgi:4-hydroxy-tetrahydrodipicolinate synthase|uniref:dihydrodipicolinate synthase family protein n=1 Tax=Anaerotruncus TaxID=244127 RepID=UPI000C76C178|nr:MULTISPECIES: dihydrodipicolinate synthase family protein [Anaerotruncus]MCQ4894756.1 dihydrodipicolinate synthase family protein [Anaerotruncus sp. DFI.9.16]GKH46294.1 4-hydroxy-tetrahydrodipicolinate synthase [Oscillospiraceae bacterium]
MQKELLFHGPASEVITPFTADGRIDFALLEEEIEYLITNGITGVFVNGLASEALMFPTEQRVEAVRRAVKAADGRIPVLGNLIYNSVDMAVDCMKRYEECGCGAIIITPPLVYKYTEEGLYRYFAGIAGQTKLPVYLYNAPETGNKLSPELIGRLFSEVPNLWGYKDSTQDIIHQQTMLRLIGRDRHFELMAGSDAQILTTSLLGGVGVFSLLTCIFPKLIVGICGAIDRGDWETARAMQEKILRVRQAMKIGPFMAAYKFVGELVGAPLGRMKAPLSEVSESDKQKIVTILKEQEML